MILYIPILRFRLCYYEYLYQKVIIILNYLGLHIATF